jgi:hypothetical protein
MDGKSKGMEEVLAESLAALEQGEGLEAVLARYPGEASELRPLLEMAAWMGTARATVEPRAGFVKASRARLLERLAEPQLSVWQRLGVWWSGLYRGGRRYALQLAVVVVMLACLVLGSSGIAYASQGTLPGDALYPVKLGVEQVQLWANLDPAEEVRLHMQFSQRRVEEIEALVSLGRYQDVKTALESYSYHMDQSLLSLEELAALDPQAAGKLAAAMQPVYSNQARSLSLLAERAVKIAREIFEQAASIAEEGAQDVEQVGEEITAYPQPTATVTPPAASPTSTPLPAASTPTPPDPKSEGAGSLASATPLATQPAGTGTPTSTGMPTARPTQTRTAGVPRNSTAQPTATRTPFVTQVATATSRPTSTATPHPPTSTSQPTSTNTPRPTNTQPPSPTSTQPPPPTHTAAPPPTNTPLPPPTNTPVPPPTEPPPTEPPPTPYP